MKKKCPAVILFLLTITLLYGCNDSPVNTDPDPVVEFDSARYRWEQIDIPFNVRDFCAVDTNHIYFFEYGGRRFITYIDRQFTPHSFADPDFTATCISNINDVVYMGGINAKNAKPMVYKYVNGSIENIPVPNYETGFFLLSAFPKSNEIWFTGTDGNILRIADNNVYRYRLDSTFYLTAITFVNNDVYATGIKNDGTKTGPTTVRISKFQSGTWILAKEQIFNSNIELGAFNPFINLIENHFYGTAGIGEIYEFNGSDFVKVLTLNEMIINRMAGLSLNDFTFSGWQDGFYNAAGGTVFNWNGSKLSVELRGYQTGNSYTTFYKNNSYLVLCATNSLVYANRLYIGKP